MTLSSEISAQTSSGTITQSHQHANMPFPSSRYVSHLTRAPNNMRVKQFSEAKPVALNLLSKIQFATGVLVNTNDFDYFMRS